MAEWLQTDLLDEIAPAGFATIDEHIARQDDGTLMLADFFGHHNRPVSHGEVVDFVRFINLGQASIAINGDWSWSLETPVPDGCNWVTIEDSWIEPEFGETVQQAVQSIRDGNSDPSELSDLVVTFYLEEHAQRRVCCERGALVEVRP